ncbi:hypothetical protein GPY51_20830 [Photorhabdus laumondii subsp. laumondii]|uniref:Uncharacterized protein n=1 Tax=Photorhabdus laumondii subsp. laumondii TaxID=141679 RepID=A0A6L9JQV1_PHOLM|nr:MULTISPECIES: hypothetical protein [Photorhabdus]AWK40493.1 hypothetical protein A4R40_02635 [Photorhabdus laumondii subsp. laumondii]AXG41302.1 hypothetical protein PluDJC_02635 [Photorhabdus laumondii subsp. laumondii]AXG45832.1 hypothetical protein PluTT01m_02715 [Photorhabdus laumondii subsp. laumondii]KTL59477.1 hypothetical protein AA106_17085 [Photorhabdus laumondii subsp. laumondii]MCC8385237.1 hypothetical protein [Photorhabdus laumondii]
MSAQTSLVRKNGHSIFHNEKNKPHYFEWGLPAVCKAVHFFYLSDQEYDIKGFIDKFEENSKFLCNVFSAIVGLHIKRIFLKELEENYEIEPEFYNSRIYLSAEKRGNIIDAFETVLPYYLAPKQNSQYEHIYLQPRGDDLLYFVSPCNSPNQTIAKENLIYNILTMDKEGKQINAMEQNITSIFLRSFTNDILRLREVSKSSLFEKIAKIYIEN